MFWPTCTRTSMPAGQPNVDYRTTDDSLHLALSSSTNEAAPAPSGVCAFEGNTTVVVKICKSVSGSKVSSQQGERRGRLPRWQFLLSAQQPGERWRERWMEKLVEEGKTKRWSEEELRRQVTMDVDAAAKQGRYKTKRSRGGVIGEGVLAGHPIVRRSFARLLRLRDRLYMLEKSLMDQIFHGPYQALTDILSKQRNPTQRHLVADHKAYLAFLKRRSTRKAAAVETAHSPATTAPAPRVERPSTPQFQSTFIFMMRHSNESASHHPRRPARP